jgi:murein DD-endopeptidase MepM/ murein hydrolase activator NlpD
MTSNKDNLDLEQKYSLKKYPYGKLTSATLFALIISTLTFNLGFANENDKEEFEKIFHVYVGNTYMGAVADKDSVNEIIEEKEQQVKKQYEDYTIDASAGVTIVPEQVFEIDTNEQTTLTKLQEAITVQAQGYALKVGGTVIASLKNREDYEAVIDGLKLQYVTQNQLDELKSRSSSTALPILQQNQTRLVDVQLSSDITGEEISVDPSKIMTVEQVLHLLKTGTPETKNYEVQAGDVLGAIAMQHNLTTEQLLRINPSITINSVLQIGQQINVTVERPYVSVKVITEEKALEEVDFEKVVVEDATMLKGEQIVEQEGVKGKREATYVITEENGVRTARVQTSENVLIEPKDYVVVIGTKVIPSVGTGTFAWPTNGGYVSSQKGYRWGRTHEGIDIARPSNYAIKASDNGIVTTAGRHSTYGNYIVVDHNNGYETLYAHLSKISVSVGQVVEQGSALGVMGSTGRSTGTHLHFEIHKKGAVMNPLAYLN